MIAKKIAVLFLTLALLVVVFLIGSVQIPVWRSQKEIDEIRKCLVDAVGPSVVPLAVNNNTEHKLIACGLKLSETDGIFSSDQYSFSNITESGSKRIRAVISDNDDGKMILIWVQEDNIDWRMINL